MGEPLDESRRRAYLRAMGIDLWVPRAGQGGAAQGPAPVESPVRPVPPVPESEPTPTPVPLAALAPEPAPRPTTETPAEPAPPWHSEPQAGPPSSWPPEPPDELSPPWPDEPFSAWGPDPTEPAVSHAQAPTITDLVSGPPDPAVMDWDALAAAVAGCRACGLCETRIRTVFGVGNRQADLMVIGEAPGADEDREGEPFVGRAGQLLNRMLAAIGLARGQVFIANILKCRPPGNRDPRPDEALSCQGFLQRQVALVQPRAILAVGRIAAQTLLCTDTSLGRLRGRWLAYGPDSIPLRVTYHPAYLLRSPDQKARAWEDLTEVARRLAEPPPGPSRPENHP
jgi:uracil-DNA glycosylase